MTFEGSKPREVGELDDHRDRRLLESVARGDERAFGELFRRYGPSAKGLAYRILADEGLAEEVLQEVFVSVWRNAASYDAHRGRVRTWLLTQVHHRAVDVVRREEAERRRSTAPSAAPGEPPSHEDVVDERWIAARRSDVRAGLEALPREQREILELAYYGGMTQAEIAKRTGVPLGTVKSRTLAAMRRMRDLLGTSEGS